MLFLCFYSTDSSTPNDTEDSVSFTLEIFENFLVFQFSSSQVQIKIYSSFLVKLEVIAAQFLVLLPISCGFIID